MITALAIGVICFCLGLMLGHLMFPQCLPANPVVPGDMDIDFPAGLERRETIADQPFASEPVTGEPRG